MKKIFVLPKRYFDKMMTMRNIDDNNVKDKVKTCFISINDSLGTDAKPHFKSNHPNVLNLFFDDVDRDIEVEGEGTAIAFTEEMAEEVFNFVFNNRDMETFVVHCTAGISRSGAVGEFINNYFGQDYKEFIKQNPYVHPNGLVLSRLNKHLWSF